MRSSAGRTRKLNISMILAAIVSDRNHAFCGIRLDADPPMRTGDTPSGACTVERASAPRVGPDIAGATGWKPSVGSDPQHDLTPWERPAEAGASRSAERSCCQTVLRSSVQDCDGSFFLRSPECVTLRGRRMRVRRGQACRKGRVTGGGRPRGRDTSARFQRCRRAAGSGPASLDGRGARRPAICAVCRLAWSCRSGSCPGSQ